MNFVHKNDPLAAVWPHRVGLGLAILIVIIALFTAITAWYSGRPLPDAASNNQLRVITARMTEFMSVATRRRRKLIRQGAVKSFASASLFTGTTRRFVFFHARANSHLDKAGDAAAIAEAFSNLKAWERRRGAVITAQEMPVLIGDVFLQEAGQREWQQLGWLHLRHAFDWARFTLAGMIGVLAVIAYWVARLLGWLFADVTRYVITGEPPGWGAWPEI